MYLNLVVESPEIKLKFLYANSLTSTSSWLLVINFIKPSKLIFRISFPYWFYPNRSKIASNFCSILQRKLLPHCCGQIHCALAPQAPGFVSNFGVLSRFRLSLQTNWVPFHLLSPFLPCNVCCKSVHILFVFKFAFSIISFLLLSFSFFPNFSERCALCKVVSRHALPRCLGFFAVFSLLLSFFCVLRYLKNLLIASKQRKNRLVNVESISRSQGQSYDDEDEDKDLSWVSSTKTISDSSEMAELTWLQQQFKHVLNHFL